MGLQDFETVQDYALFLFDQKKAELEAAETAGNLWKAYDICVRLSGVLYFAHGLNLIHQADFERWDAYVDSKLEPLAFGLFGDLS